MALAGSRFGITVDLTDIRSSDVGSAPYRLGVAFGWDVEAGTGSGQANLIWGDTRAVTTGATDNVDLSDALSDIFGLAVFTVCKGIAIQASPANTTILTVSSPTGSGLPFILPAAANFALGPGDMFGLTQRVAGWTVTAATGDIIRVVNAAGATANFTIALLGLA